MKREIAAGLAALALVTSAASQAQGAEGVYASDQFDALRAKSKVEPRGRQPIERKKYDAAVAKLFDITDTNRDGTVTLTEVQAIIAGRAEQAIQARFSAIDANRDKTLTYAEFSAWQRALGSAALSDESAGAGAGIVAPEIRAAYGRGTESELIADLVQPLSSTVVVAANTNYDAGMSLSELLAYEGKRFDDRDANHDGWLNDSEAREQSAAAAPARPRG
ncbi:MAG: hypothetical protein ABIT09_07865 [Croceibacterium sp.]